LRLCVFARVNKKYFARKAAKASGSQTERITNSLRLCAFARKKKKKKNMAPRNSAGQAAKPPSRKESAAAEGRQAGILGIKRVTALLLL
jgi:hypothetical protein